MRDLASIIEAYRQEWHQNGPPPFWTSVLDIIASNLADTPDTSRTAQKLFWALAKTDLQLRWASEVATDSEDLPARPQIEDYLRLLKQAPDASLAKFRGDSFSWQIPVSIIAAEMKARWRAFDRVAPADYLRRFPQLTEEQLRSLKKLADALSMETVLPQQDPFAFLHKIKLSVQEFAKRVVRSGLMPKGDIEQSLRQLPKKDRTLETLARSLHSTHRFTPYQVRSIVDNAKTPLVLGDYVICDQIGRGGMGEVFHAVHRRMDRDVALKVILAKNLKDGLSVRRFAREVRAAAKLNHPNIVTAHDARQQDGIHYLVMEYIPGTNLGDLVVNRGSLRSLDAIDYTLQAARGLEYAHQHGVVHRDIKPANLLLANDGTVKILDMGLARMSDAPESRVPHSLNDELTENGAFMGTVDFMAPEQALDSKHADERSDIYSLGCTLFFLIAGKPMFGGNTLMKRILAHREAPIPRLVDDDSRADSALQLVLEHMVAKKPTDRYASMPQVINALQQVKTLAEQPAVQRPVPIGAGAAKPSRHSGPVAPAPPLTQQPVRPNGDTKRSRSTDDTDAPSKLTAGDASNLELTGESNSSGQSRIPNWMKVSAATLLLGSACVFALHKAGYTPELLARLRSFSLKSDELHLQTFDLAEVILDLPAAFESEQQLRTVKEAQQADSDLNRSLALAFLVERQAFSGQAALINQDQIRSLYRQVSVGETRKKLERIHPLPPRYVDYLEVLLASQLGLPVPQQVWLRLNRKEAAESLGDKLRPYRCILIANWLLELAVEESGVPDEDVIEQRFIHQGSSDAVRRAQRRVTDAQWWLSLAKQASQDDNAQRTEIDTAKVHRTSDVQSLMAEIADYERNGKSISTIDLGPVGAHLPSPSDVEQNGGQLWRAVFEVARAYCRSGLAASEPDGLMQMRRFWFRSASAIIDIHQQQTKSSLNNCTLCRQSILEPVVDELEKLVTRGKTGWELTPAGRKTLASTDDQQAFLRLLEYLAQTDEGQWSIGKNTSIPRSPPKLWTSQEMALALLARSGELADRSQRLLRAADLFYLQKQSANQPWTLSDLDTLDRYLSRSGSSSFAASRLHQFSRTERQLLEDRERKEKAKGETVEKEREKAASKPSPVAPKNPPAVTPPPTRSMPPKAAAPAVHNPLLDNELSELRESIAGVNWVQMQNATTRSLPPGSAAQNRQAEALVTVAELAVDYRRAIADSLSPGRSVMLAGSSRTVRSKDANGIYLQDASYFAISEFPLRDADRLAESQTWADDQRRQAAAAVYQAIRRKARAEDRRQGIRRLRDLRSQKDGFDPQAVAGALELVFADDL